MRIVCDCGNEMPFNITDELDEYGESYNAFTDREKMSFAAEHDEFWITCEKCKKSIRVMV